MRDYYITTPIFYVNDVPHIGHAYTSVACDVLARFKRLDGYRVLALTGTDEHGQKIEQAARSRGITPGELTDEVSENFRALAPLLDLSFDDFIRTSQARHSDSVRAFWQLLVERDMIYPGQYAGWYSVRDESFYTEDELITDDQGRKLAPTGAEIQWVEEPGFFFRLQSMQQPLLDWYERNPDAIAPQNRRNEVLSFVRGGLHDLSISRTSIRWGVPVPDHPDHVIYVWVDALVNYISALGFPDRQSERFDRFWPCDLHMVGKDILRFHAVYWPAMLLAAGLEPPRRVFAHGWWTNEGQKMSKSLGNVIRPEDLVAAWGLDPVRYFLLRDLPFGRDGDFQQQAMIHRINGDLANDLGNLVQRVLTLVQRNLSGARPALAAQNEAQDRALLDQAARMPDRLRSLMDQQAFHQALEEIWQLIGEANRYVDREAPWKLAREAPERGRAVLAVLVSVLRATAIPLQAFMPQSAGRILDQLGVGPDQRQMADLAHPMAGEVALPPPVPLFPRHGSKA